MKMALMIYPTPWDLECANRCPFTCPGVAFALSDIIDYALVGILDFPVPPQHNTTQLTHAAPPTMAPSQTLYPRATVKRIVKAHSNRPLSKNADIMVRHQLSATLLLHSASPPRRENESGLR